MKKAPYDVPDLKKIRVIIDTDTNCECDDQYAIVHAMLTPKFDVKAIIAEHYGTMRESDSMNKSYEEIHKVLTLMNLSDFVPVFKGSIDKLTDENTPRISEGAEFIVKEAISDDSRQLFVVCQGALTNVASAYLINPEIAKKITIIWIGGGKYPSGGWEFNLNNDINSANVIFDSNIPLWQVPINVYSLMKVSFMELWEKVSSCGVIGEYLFDNTIRINNLFTKIFASLPKLDNESGFPPGESWQLGDSVPIGLMLSDHEFHYDIIPAPRFNNDCSYIQRLDNSRKIRVYNYVDSRFILEDMFSKLKYYYGNKQY